MIEDEAYKIPVRWTGGDGMYNGCYQDAAPDGAKIYSVFRGHFEIIIDGLQQLPPSGQWIRQWGAVGAEF